MNILRALFTNKDAVVMTCYSFALMFNTTSFEYVIYY